MSDFAPRDPAFEQRVRDSFAAQPVMQTAGVSLIDITPGCVELRFSHDKRLTQHHGFIHAGIMSTVLDSACGYAAMTLMPANTTVLTVEFKVNLLAPASGAHYLAVGRVRKSGKTISVSDGDLFAVDDAERRLVATMTGTLMCVGNR